MEPDTPQARIAARPPFTSVLRAVVSHRGVQAVAILWLAGTATALWLARGSLPFDRPAVAGLPFVFQMAAPTVGLIEIFGLMAVVFILTRTRAIPDMAARAPERRVALRETGLVLAYAALGQAGGWIVGPALGYRPFSFHIAGTVFGCTVPPEPAEVWTRFAPQYRAVASVRALSILRARDDEERSDAAHGQRLGPRTRLPRHRTACGDRHVARREGLPHHLTASLQARTPGGAALDRGAYELH